MDKLKENLIDKLLHRSTRAINYIVVHCTGTNSQLDISASDIDIYHKSLGWSGIGYNYVIKLDGTFEMGRDVNLIPSHVKGFNKNSIGIVYVGGLDSNLKPTDTRTEEQKKTLILLLTKLKFFYPKARILGHRDFIGVKKDCPCFNVKKEYYGKI